MERYLRRDVDQAERSQLHNYINRNVIAVQNAVRDAGTLRKVVNTPPPAYGGIVYPPLDPFQNIFEIIYDRSMMRPAMDQVEQAIGVYEHIENDTGLINLFERETIDIESAIERSLRPSFKHGPPESEEEVQDHIETILNALGVAPERDREVAPSGGKSFRPDFVISEMDLAIEVKLSKPNHSVAKIQEEINADISAYKTKWSRLLFVVYDLGAIHDPYKLRADNLKLFGVSLIVVKH